MADRSWRFIAQAFDGTGNLGEFLDFNLPLESVSIEENLSGHNSLSATITPEVARLKRPDGTPVFDEWGACIWAESPNGEVYGGVLEKSGLNGPEWSLECLDLTGLSVDLPFTDANSWVNVDPIDIFRFIWAWIQSQPGSNLGMTLDPTTSPARLGTDLVEFVEFDTEAPELFPDPVNPSPYANNAAWVTKAKKKLSGKPWNWKKDKIEDALNHYLSGNGREFDVTFTHFEIQIVRTALQVLGPPPNPPGQAIPNTPSMTNPPPGPTYQYDAYKLNWYTNHDLSSDLDDLATNTPFDWHLVHRWSDEGDEPDLFHHVRIGYPKLGRRITDLRFVIGENIHTIPGIDRDGEEYADTVIVLGNGEGAAMVRGQAFRPHPGRVRRVAVVTDQSLTTVEACNRRASEELARRIQIEEITELEVIDHPHAPIGSVLLGDEFYVEGSTGWGELGTWVRCVGRRFAPSEGDKMTLMVVRSDRLA